MRISLYSGSTLYPIAGSVGVSERAHSSAADFQLTPESAIQIANYVRGIYAKPLDRGNLLNVLSFSTTRQFASVAEAQLWCLDYAGAIPASGTVYFDAISPGGIATRRTMADAVINPPRRRVIGATALIDYSIQGGAIASVAAAAALDVTGTLTSDGSTAVTFPELEGAGFHDGKPAYTNGGVLTGYGYSILWFGALSKWVLTKTNVATWHSSSDTATPDLATGWTAQGTATGTPTVALA